MKRVRLRVIGGSVELDDGVPRSRTECRDGPRPCPHVNCRAHLWRVDSCDTSGRPYDGKRQPTTLRFVQLMWPLPPSCMWDEVERHPDGLLQGEVGERLGLSKSGVGKEETAVMEKLRDLNLLDSLGLDAT